MIRAMTTTELLPQLLQLPVVEKLRVLDALTASLEESGEVDETTRRALDERWEEHLEDEGSAMSVDDFRAYYTKRRACAH